MLVATINSSILLIALPDIFRGIGVDPLAPGNTSYLLWLILGFLVVMAVLLVSLGRLGDIYGRVRMFNLGFAVFTVFSILLSITWMHGTAAALWLIADARRPGRRRRAAVRATRARSSPTRSPPTSAGSRSGSTASRWSPARSLGLVLGGVLAPVSLAARLPRLGAGRPVRDGLGVPQAARARRCARPARIDWWGNLDVRARPVAVMVGITYGIQPYGGHTMGWTAPFVLAMLIGGIVLLAVFCVIETRVEEPMFHLDLFRIRAFTRRQPRGAAGGDGARRPAVHPDHLAAGDLAARARLQLLADAALGRASTCCR